MKLIISFLILFLSITTLSQTNNIPVEIEDYINLLKLYSTNIKVSKEDLKTKIPNEVLNRQTSEKLLHYQVLQNIDNLSMADIKHFLNVRNVVYEKYPFQVLKIILKYDEDLKNLQNTKEKKNNLELKITEGLFRAKIEKMFSHTTAELLEIPFVLRVVIKKVYNDNRTIAGNKNIPDLTLKEFNVKAQITDIIKGKDSFNIGDYVEFYFQQWWNKTGESIYEGEEYLVNLLPRIDKKSEIFSLMFFNDGFDGIFNVKGDYVFDKNNYFEFGQKLQWSQFRNFFNKKYLDNN